MDSRPYSIAPGRSFSDGGFTLVELMITVLIAGLIMAAIMAAYISQQRTYLAQEQVAEMQQNIRAALHIMTKEIRMAGYDRDGSAGAGITNATLDRISFTQDITEDGQLDGLDENISFGFDPNDDADADGIADLGTAVPLRRWDPTAPPLPPLPLPEIAENIQAIEFRYLDDTNTVTAVPADIRTVQISILARAGQIDPNIINNNQTYTTASGVIWGPFNDNFRRRFVISSIQCRNLGLL